MRAIWQARDFAPTRFLKPPKKSIAKNLKNIVKTVAKNAGFMIFPMHHGPPHPFPIQSTGQRPRHRSQPC